MKSILSFTLALFLFAGAYAQTAETKAADATAKTTVVEKTAETGDLPQAEPAVAVDSETGDKDAAKGKACCAGKKGKACCKSKAGGASAKGCGGHGHVHEKADGETAGHHHSHENADGEKLHACAADCTKPCCADKRKKN